MNYSSNTFLSLINNKNIKIFDIDSNLKFTIKPISIDKIINELNLIKIYLKSNKILTLDFISNEDSSNAYQKLQEHILNIPTDIDYTSGTYSYISNLQGYFYTYDKFLRPITESDRNIKILDDMGIVKYTIDPFFINNVAISNNLLNINLKSDRVITLNFSTINESKIALSRIQQQIDLLTNNIPYRIDKDIQNYLDDRLSNLSGGGGDISTTTPIRGNGNIEDPLTLSYDNTHFVVNNQLELNIDFKIIVTPIIVSQWRVYKNDGTSFSKNIGSVYIDSVINSNNIIVPIGCKVNYIGTASISSVPNGYSLPTNVYNNDYLGFPSEPVSYPIYGVKIASNVSTNTTYKITCSKPKSGFIIDNTTGQLSKATGIDISSASAIVSFQDIFYYGYINVGSLNTVISQSEVDSLTSDDIQNLNIYRFGGKSQQFFVNDSQYRLVFAYKSTYGSISSVTLVGSSINQSASFIRSTSNRDINIISGLTQTYTYYVAKSPNSFNTTITIIWFNKFIYSYIKK